MKKTDTEKLRAEYRKALQCRDVGRLAEHFSASLNGSEARPWKHKGDDRLRLSARQARRLIKKLEGRSKGGRKS